jgi:hypothetical protein
MKTPWTAKQLQILRNNAGKLKADEIGKLIGKSKYSIQQRACKYGISLKLPIEKTPTGCSYEKALPPERWNDARSFLAMMGKLKSVIPNDVKPILDLEQLREVFAIRERVVHG